MAKKNYTKHTYEIFYDNNERAQKLSADDFELYLNLIDYQIKHKESMIHIDIIMSNVLDEFEKAVAAGRSARSVVGKDFKDYLRKVKKQIKLDKELENMRKKDYEKFTFSGIWFTICAFLVLLFVKEVLTDHYLLGYYVDLVIGAVALYLGFSNIYQHHKIIKRWNFSKKSLIIVLVGFILSIFVMLFTLRSPFDVTFLILVASHLSAKAIIKKEFEQAT